MGRIYVGGDDILLMVPGYLAIPISLIIINEFYKKMGGATLSVGVYLYHPKSSIWNGISTAKYLLDVNAKSIGRGTSKDKIGSIDFQSEFSGISDLSSPKTKKYTCRPYLISKDQKIPNNFLNLLKCIIPSSQFNINIPDILNEDYLQLLSFIYNELDQKFKNNSTLKRFKDICKKLEPIFWEDQDDIIKAKQKAISFLLYKYRDDSNLNNFLDLIGDFMSEHGLMLYDSIDLIKIMSGGLL